MQAMNCLVHNIFKTNSYSISINDLVACKHYIYDKTLDYFYKYIMEYIFRCDSIKFNDNMYNCSTLQFLTFQRLMY